MNFICSLLITIFLLTQLFILDASKKSLNEEMFLAPKKNLLKVGAGERGTPGPTPNYTDD